MPAFLLQPIHNGPGDIHNRFIASDLSQIWLVVVAYKRSGGLWAVLIFFFSLVAGLVFCVDQKDRLDTLGTECHCVVRRDRTYSKLVLNSIDDTFITSASWHTFVPSFLLRLSSGSL